MKSISWKAVIVSNVFDIVVSGLLGALALLCFLYARHEDLSLLTEDQLKGLLADPSIFWTGSVVGGAVSFTAGYLAATIARRAEMLNGALSSLLCVSGGIYALFSNSDAESAVQTVSLIFVSPGRGARARSIQEVKMLEPLLILGVGIYSQSPIGDAQ